MKINGFSKLTLLDYPGHLAATIFVGGCNMRCPFCHNASLVTNAASQPIIPAEEILSVLSKRKSILEGVCISGGEPTLYAELPEFMKDIKAMGYRIKLDTNGTNPSMIKSLIKDKLIDYVAMDIKNSREKYALTSGIPDFNRESLEESIAFLLTSPIDYEFRTTIVKELHTKEDILSIGQWLKGADAYFLQAYRDSEDVLMPGFHSHTKETMNDFISVLSPYIRHVSLRGVD